MITEDNSVNTGAADILGKIEKDVNEGTFDKELYRNDINKLKGQPSELRYLKVTLSQLKEHLPQYTEYVDAMQHQIEEMENNVEVMFDNEVNRALRFNDSVASLVELMGNRRVSDGTLQNNGKDLQSENNTGPDHPVLLDDGIITQAKEGSDDPVKQGLLLEQMLNLVEQPWVTEADFESLPEKIGVEDLQLSIFVMTKVVDLIRTMPEDMFANNETKQNIFAAAQENLDGLVEQEAEEEMDGYADVEQGFGIVGEVTADIEAGSMATTNEEGQVPGINK